MPKSNFCWFQQAEPGQNHQGRARGDARHKNHNSSELKDRSSGTEAPNMPEPARHERSC